MKSSHKKNQKKAQKAKQRKEKLRQQKHNELQQGFKKVSAKLSEEELDLILDEALADYQQGYKQEAIQSLIDLYDDYGKDPHLNYTLGVLFIQEEDFVSAKGHLELATLLDEGLLEAHFNLAYVYEQLGRIDSALMVHTEIVEEFDSTHDLAKKSQAILDDFNEDSDVSVDDFIHASIIFHEAMDVFEGENYQEAKELFEKSIDINPYSPTAHGNQAICLASLGFRDEALKHLDEALELSPDYTLAQNNRRLIAALKPGEKLQTKVKITNTLEKSFSE